MLTKRLPPAPHGARAGLRHRARVLPLLTVLGLLLGGCTAEARDDIVDQIEDIVASVSPEPTPTPSATGEPTPDATPTDEPAPDAATEEPAPPSPTDEPTASEEPVPEPTAEPEPPADPDETGLGDEPWWLLLIGLVLLLWLVVALFRRRRRIVARRRTLRDTVLAEVDWLLGRATERPAGVDAAARARDIRVRSDRLAQDVQELRAAAPRTADLCRDLQTSARQLTEALIARLDDVARTGESGTGLGVAELAERLRADRDALATELGRPPTR